MLELPPHAQELIPQDPRWLDSYAVLARLGQGGQGVVYLGASEDGRPVAIKMIHMRDRRHREQFAREAEHARRMPPFCVAQVLDVSLDVERPYIVTEYVDGPSLLDLVTTRGPLVGADLDRLAIGMATGLAAIHERNLVHRDFKPANVIVASGGPRIIDFGIARSGTTAPAALAGTPDYMAPEQCDHLARVGRACDLWAWAATVVFATTGRPPFADVPTGELYEHIKNRKPHLPDLVGPLGPLVARCFEKDPARRPTARQVLDALIGRYGGTDDAEILTQGEQIAATLFDEDSPVARYEAQAQLSFAEGKFALARQYATRGIESHVADLGYEPVHARCFMVRGLARERLGEDGFDDLQIAHEIDTDNLDIAIAFGAALISRDKAEAAIQIAVKSPDLAIPYARALAEKGDRLPGRPAPQEVRVALRIAPQDDQVRQGYLTAMLHGETSDGWEAFAEAPEDEAVIQHYSRLLAHRDHGADTYAHYLSVEDQTPQATRERIDWLLAEIVPLLMQYRELPLADAVLNELSGLLAGVPALSSQEEIDRSVGGFAAELLRRSPPDVHNALLLAPNDTTLRHRCVALLLDANDLAGLQQAARIEPADPEVRARVIERLISPDTLEPIVAIFQTLPKITRGEVLALCRQHLENLAEDPTIDADTRQRQAEHVSGRLKLVELVDRATPQVDEEFWSRGPSGRDTVQLVALPLSASAVLMAVAQLFLRTQVVVYLLIVIIPLVSILGGAWIRHRVRWDNNDFQEDQPRNPRPHLDAQPDDDQQDESQQ